MREHLRRGGYDEIKTPQILDTELWHRSGPLGQLPREHVLRRALRARPRRVVSQLRGAADELPRRLPHVFLRAPLLPRPAPAAGRVRPRIPLRARGRPPRPAASPRLHPGRRTRLLHARAGRRRGGLDLRGDRPARTPASGSTRCGSSCRPDRRSRSAPTSSGSRRPRRCAQPLERQGRPYRREPRRGHLLRAEDRLPRHRRARPLLAVRHVPGRLPDARALRAHLPGRGQRRAPAGDDPPRPARLDGALRRAS